MQTRTKLSIAFPEKSIQEKEEEEEEKKEIEEALKTPFEKVISILSKVKHKLQDSNDPLEKDIEWVINIIHSKRMYSFQGIQKSSKIKQDSMEMKSFMGYLDQFSETKTLSSSKKLFKTTKLKSITNTFKINQFLQKKAKSVLLKSKSEEEKYNQCQVQEGIFFENDSSENQNYYILKVPNRRITSQRSEQFQFIEEKNIDIDALPNALLSSKSFDIYSYFEQYDDKAFEYGAYGILSNFSFEKYSSTAHIKSFISEVKNKYSKEAYYHNEMHGLDVLQTIFVYISSTSFVNDLCLNDIDIFSLVIGALVHDLGHSGYSNDFQIKTQSDLAIRYNDRNVLENYHVSTAFEILRCKESNILEKMGKEEYLIFRKRMIELILSTDMLFHSKICALMRSHINSESGKLFPFNQDSVFEEQQNVLNFLLHAADISHCSKDFAISSKWTLRINQEFWRQGDFEKENNLPISFLCDRDCANVPRSQIGYIKGIIIPTFDLLTLFLPELLYYKDNVNNNLLKWGELINDKDNDNANDEKSDKLI